MFQADVMMAQHSGLLNGTFDDLFELWGQPNLCRDAVGFLTHTDFNRVANFGQIHTEVAQDTDCNPFAYEGEDECEVFGADVVFFFNDTATTEIYTLSLHDALPI